MDYYNKYIKYKTKYLQLKYDNNQYGGGVVPCNIPIKNRIGTCWMVAIQVCLFFGDLTSKQFNDVMMLFTSGTPTERIINRDAFIDIQIDTVQTDSKLYNFLPWKIFYEPKREFLKIMLRKIIDRYNSKVFKSPITIKPQDITDDETNPLRCETVILENYTELFDYPIIKHRLTTSKGGDPGLNGYLFCNLLSIFFLNYKVSFTNYYNNFSSIDFHDETDIGILIAIENHICCLFICNNKGQYYNDNDYQVYECDWKTLLKTPATNLYVKRGGCFEFIYDIDKYDKTKISKVLYLTKISKYEKKSELDSDIIKALTLTNVETIEDPSLLLYLGAMYYKGTFVKRDLLKAFNLYNRSVNNGVPYKGVYGFLGNMYENGIATKVDFEEALRLYILAISKGNKDVFVKLGNMYENGRGTDVNLEEAFKYYTLAKNNGNTDVFVKLGNMYENGRGTDVNLEEAFKYYTLAKNNGNTDVFVKLGNMYENGRGTDVNLEEAFKLYTLAINNKDKTLESSDDKDITLVQSAAKGDAPAYIKVGEIYEEGTRVAKDLTKALEWYKKGQKKFPAIHDFKKKHDLVLIKLADENNISAIFDLVRKESNDYIKIKELLIKGIEILKTYPDPYFGPRFNEKLMEIEELLSEENIRLQNLYDRADEDDIDALFELGNRYIQGDSRIRRNLGLKQDLVKAKNIAARASKIVKNMPDKQLEYNRLLESIKDIEQTQAE